MKQVAIASVLAAMCGMLFAVSQVPRRKTVLAISPSYFECVHCESFHRHKQFIERQYPGTRVLEIKVDEAGAKALGIEGFPTIIVGETVIGYGTEQRKRVQELLGGGQ